MRKLLLGTALFAALGASLDAEIVSVAKADGHPAQRPACRLAAAARPLKLIRSTIVVDNAINPSPGRIIRRANYIELSATNPREQAPRATLVLLERQQRPANLVVGVGY